MEAQKKCSCKKHSELNAISFCPECDIYLCNKCVNSHSELLESHQIYNLDKNIEEIFNGKCKEFNHKMELEYFCETHNKLCCAACLSKIKDKENGKHHDCNVCFINDIEEEKKDIFYENFKYLEEFSDKIEDLINKLEQKFREINDKKEELKAKIAITFTKIRNYINERENKIFLEVDNLFDKKYFKQSFINNNEYLPSQTKLSLERSKVIDKDWDNSNIKLNSKINDCINIENNIKKIHEIEKCNSHIINFKFIPENDDEINKILNKIKNFGKVLDMGEDILEFKFREGDNYKVTYNGLVATKNSGGNKWNCTIIGDKEIPKNKISKWKIKIKTESQHNCDILIGIGPNNPDNESDFYRKCWSFVSSSSQIILKSGNIQEYNNHSGRLKEGDIMEVIVDRELGNLSFSVNGSNYGIACSEIPKEDKLFPTVLLYEENLIVEIT